MEYTGEQTHEGEDGDDAPEDYSVPCFDNDAEKEESDRGLARSDTNICCNVLDVSL